MNDATDLRKENTELRKKLMQAEIQASMASQRNRTQERISNEYLDYSASLIWTGQIDPAVCKRWLEDLRKKYEFVEGTVMTLDGPTPRADIRNNTRMEIRDQELADQLWSEISGAAWGPKRVLDYYYSGVSDYIRVYRYEPGQYFKPHLDHSWRKNKNERTLATVLIYLNGGYEGGETVFPDYGRVIQPEAGLFLGFQHPLLHEGKEVTKGEKYVLRFDVLYKRLSCA